MMRRIMDMLDAAPPTDAELLSRNVEALRRNPATKALRVSREHYHFMFTEIARLRADNERLSKLVAELTKNDGDAEAVCNSYAAENQRFHDTIEQMRAAVNAVMRGAAGFDADAGHVKIPRELIGRLRLAVDNEQQACPTEEGKRE